MISAYGGFLVAQAAAKRMLRQGAGTILLTGASASVKGYPLSAVFAMGKFALRGLAKVTIRDDHAPAARVEKIVVAVIIKRLLVRVWQAWELASFLCILSTHTPAIE